MQSHIEGDLDMIADLDAIFSAELQGEKQSTVEEKRAARIRLVGQNVNVLAIIFPEIVDCLRPYCEGPSNAYIWPDGSPESSEELGARVTCWAYVHFLRSLSALNAAWVMRVGLDEHGAYFLGELFVRLVHRSAVHKKFMNTSLFAHLGPFFMGIQICVLAVFRFALHKSLNTFLFAQVGPFLMDTLKDVYRLSNSKALSLGSYCRNEGGELTNQSSKGNGVIHVAPYV